MSDVLAFRVGDGNGVGAWRGVSIMSSHGGAGRRAGTARAGAVLAVERVLRAESDAQAALEQARRDADAQLERARDDALAIVNRALTRVVRWQQAHTGALAAKVEALRAQAAASAGALKPLDQAVTDAAARRVAGLLTDSDNEVPGDGAH